MVYDAVSQNIYTYKFDPIAETVSEVGNLTQLFMTVNATEAVISYGVANNCNAIRFNQHIFHLNSDNTTYSADNLPANGNNTLFMD